MAARDYKQFVQSVFEPLASAAERMDLLDKLKTQHLPEDRTVQQYERFRTFNLDISDVVYLPNGGFAALYSHVDGKYLAISGAGLITQDEKCIIEWANRCGFEQDSFDESTFICFAHYLKGYYRLADQFRGTAEALNVIDVTDEEYSGHAFSELFFYFRPVLVFRIPEDSSYFGTEIFGMAAELCCHSEALRSTIIDNELASAFLELVAAPTIPSENVFQATTASHFKHVFLELYRCLESIFFLPWILDLKSNVNDLQGRAVDLKESCRAALRWREKEEPSMEKLFELFRAHEALSQLEDRIDHFKELKHGEHFNRAQLGRRLYAIRNGMVHHEDFKDPNPYKPNDIQWRHLSLYIAQVLLAITSEFERDLTPASLEV